MAVVISLGIAAVVVAFVAAPFFLLTGRPSEEEPRGSDTSEALAELLLAAVRDTALPDTPPDDEVDDARENHR